MCLQIVPSYNRRSLWRVLYDRPMKYPVGGRRPGHRRTPASSRRAWRSTSSDPDSERYANGAALPGPDAKLAGPTFEEWLDATVPAGRA